MIKRSHLVAALLLSSASLFAQSPASDASGEKAAVKETGFQTIAFTRLASYSFIPPADDSAAAAKSISASDEQIPTEVKKLNGSKITIAGFMLPVKMENGLVTEFLLLKDQSGCCYGVVPNMNEWVIVKMPKNGVKPFSDTLVFVSGTLKVGAVMDNNYLAGIYTLDGEKMEF
jgi:hypothetical protein